MVDGEISTKRINNSLTERTAGPKRARPAPVQSVTAADFADATQYTTDQIIEKLNAEINIDEFIAEDARREEAQTSGLEGGGGEFPPTEIDMFFQKLWQESEENELAREESYRSRFQNLLKSRTRQPNAANATTTATEAKPCVQPPKVTESSHLKTKLEEDVNTNKNDVDDSDCDGDDSGDDENEDYTYDTLWRRRAL